MNETNTAYASNANEDSSWEGLRSAIQGRWSELKREDIDKLKGRVNRLVTLVKEKYSLSVDDAKKQVSEFEDSLEDSASQMYKAASDSVSNRYRTVRDGVSEFAEDVKTYGVGTTSVNLVREYPVTAVTAAFILGALLAGGAVRSRRRYWY